MLLQQLRRTVPLVQVAAAAASGGMEVSVRRVVGSKSIEDAGVFSFNMKGPGARWCANKGRCHQRNFAYWVADVLRGRAW